MVRPPRGCCPTRRRNGPARSGRSRRRRAACPATRARSGSRNISASASTSDSSRLPMTPADGGTTAGTSVVASATTGSPSIMDSIRESPSDVHRTGCRYTRRRASSTCSSDCGRSSWVEMRPRQPDPRLATCMPNTSRGTNRAKTSSRSCPTTRPRRTGSFDDDRGRLDLAGVAVAGIDHAVLDDGRAGAAGVPVQRVGVRHVHDDDVATVSRRVTHRGDRTRWGVVLEVHQADIASESAGPEPLASQFLLMGSLEDHHVDRLFSQLLARPLHRGRGPVPGPRPSATVRSALLVHGDDVAVPTLYEGGRPRTVHVPDEDVHGAILPALCRGSDRPASRSIARTTSCTDTESTHGCPERGHARLRQPAQAMV